MQSSLATSAPGQVPAPGPAGRSPLIKGYMLGLLVRPFVTTLLVVLPALLLERLLRLFDLLAGSGAMSPIVQMLLYLSPHYIGLALPAAFFISIFSTIASSSEHHELDALQSIGVSLAQLSRPFLAVGLALAVMGVAVYGYLQPIGRYQYRAALDATTHAGWNAAVVAGEFIRIGHRLTVTADKVDDRTGLLSGVFIEQRHPDGAVATTTARTGWLTSTPDAAQLVLELEEGTQLTIAPDGKVTTLHFGNSSISRHFTIALPTFRPRGDDEREMTLDELWNLRLTSVAPASAGTDVVQATPPAATPATAPIKPSVARRRMVSELHGRLVRAASLVLLPLLAMPMALGAQRTRRWYGGALSALIMMVYHHAVQLAESLGDLGVLDPRLMLWGVFAAFALFCVLVFRHAQRHPHQGPFDGLFAGMEQAFAAAFARLPRRRGRPAR